MNVHATSAHPPRRARPGGLAVSLAQPWMHGRDVVPNQQLSAGRAVEGLGHISAYGVAQWVGGDLRCDVCGSTAKGYALSLFRGPEGLVGLLRSAAAGLGAGSMF
jgi:hypothetical protein